MKTQTAEQNETFWTDISSRKAWSIANNYGKLPPYAGYLIELPDGRLLRCRKDAHKTVFEIRDEAKSATKGSKAATKGLRLQR